MFGADTGNGDGDGDGNGDGDAGDYGDGDGDGEGDVDGDVDVDGDAGADAGDGDGGGDAGVEVGEDAASDAAEVGGGDAPPDTADVPPAVTCEAPVVNLLDPAYAHPSRARTRRVPAGTAQIEDFPALPAAGGCFAPPVQCAGGAGLDGTEVLHRWVPPAPGRYYATTDVFFEGAAPEWFGGTGFTDPVLYLLDGGSPTAGVLGCNDDRWPGETQSAFTFEVLPAEDGEGLDPVWFVVDATNAAGNGRRYSLEVGPVEVATVAGAACQYPTIGTTCGEGLYCVPEGDVHRCRTPDWAPPPLLSEVQTTVVFPPEPPDEPPCRGVARDEGGNIIPIVQLQLALAGETALAVQRVSLTNALFGGALVVDVPEGPVPSIGGTFELELHLCLPETLVPFSDGSNPVGIAVRDDLGERTDPAIPDASRWSNEVEVDVPDPRSE